MFFFEKKNQKTFVFCRASCDFMGNHYGDNPRSGVVVASNADLNPQARTAEMQERQRNKKVYSLRIHVARAGRVSQEQKFFCFFFSKKKCFLASRLDVPHRQERGVGMLRPAGPRRLRRFAAYVTQAAGALGAGARQQWSRGLEWRPGKSASARRLRSIYC
jgi:hypothetical protein